MSQWAAFNSVEMAEAGYNLHAQNPTSNAYGMAQFINGPAEYYQWGGNPNTAGGQFTGMFNYIRQRYGNPVAAAAHERAFNWYGSGTAGAAPGWAWVGERGPELVRMVGGEEVVPNHLIGGFAGGTEEAIRGASLIKQFAGAKSVSDIQKGMHHYLSVIAAYFTGAGARQREDLVKRQTTAMENAARDLHDLKARQKAERSYQQSVFSNLKSYGALSGLDLGPTPGVGDNVPLSGGQGLKIQLNSKLANLKKFAAALKKLHQLKLPNSLFRQIVDMGPDQGLQYAQEIISGGADFVKALSGIESQITKQERSISQGAASTVYQGRYLTGAAFSKALNANRPELERLFKHLGHTLGEEAARWFHVPKGKRPKGFAMGGILTEPVWGIGVSGQEYTFGEMGNEMFAPMTTPRHVGMGRGGDVFNITVNGDTDPDAAAFRIIQKVRDYKRHHGNQPTGIG